MDNEKPKTEKAASEVPRYLSIGQFMERTTLSRTTVWRRIKAGLIRPVVRDEGRVLIGASALRSMGGRDGEE